MQTIQIIPTLQVIPVATSGEGEQSPSSNQLHVHIHLDAESAQRLAAALQQNNAPLKPDAKNMTIASVALFATQQILFLSQVMKAAGFAASFVPKAFHYGQALVSQNSFVAALTTGGLFFAALKQKLN